MEPAERLAVVVDGRVTESVGLGAGAGSGWVSIARAGQVQAGDSVPGRGAAVGRWTGDERSSGE